MRVPFATFIEVELETTVLLITCGLPGSWKTETSEEVHKIRGYHIIRSDLVRLEVLKGEDIFDVSIAADMGKREAVYDEVFRQASECAARGQGVILDATFVTQSLRRRAAEIAAANNRTFVIMQTSCPQAVSLARIMKRTTEKYESNALTEQAYLDNKAQFEDVNLDDFIQLYPDLDVLHFVVDTTEDAPDDWYVIDATRK